MCMCICFNSLPSVFFIKWWRRCWLKPFILFLIQKHSYTKWLNSWKNCVCVVRHILHHRSINFTYHISQSMRERNHAKWSHTHWNIGVCCFIAFACFDLSILSRLLSISVSRLCSQWCFLMFRVNECVSVCVIFINQFYEKIPEIVDNFWIVSNLHDLVIGVICW